MNRHFIILAMSVLVAACQPSVSDLQTYIQQVNASTQVMIEPYPEFKQMAPYVYQGRERRSPFLRPQMELAEMAQVSQANCPQPNMRRAKEPLERFGIDALDYKGSFWSSGDAYALIQTNTGRLYKVKKGDYLGLFYGQVEEINKQAVVIIEMLPDGTGCWQKKQAKLTKSSAAGDRDNV